MSHSRETIVGDVNGGALLHESSNRISQSQE
jgi:hypothetical protein